VRRRAGIPGYPIRTPAEQRCGAPGVPAPRVRKANRDLGEPLPQITLGGGRGLPRGLEHLVRVKRALGVEQLLGKLERLGRREDEIVRDPFVAGRAAWQRPAQRVTWPGIASPPRRITITPARARAA
jgi:hypothetical protein